MIMKTINYKRWCKKLKQITAIVLLLCLMVSSTGLQLLEAKAETGDEMISTKTTYICDGFIVAYNIINEWQNGQQIEITITNTTNEAIKNWCVKFDAGGTIENIWDAVVEKQDGTEYVIRNNAYNEEIPANQSIKFGYVLIKETSEEKTAAPESFILTQEKREVADNYDIKYTITNDWGSGFQGTLTILNKSPEPIEDWQLVFCSNAELNNVWNADWMSEGSVNTLTAYSWSNVIPAGESISIGFTGIKAEGTEVVFENFYMTEIVVYPSGAGNTEIPEEPATDDVGTEDPTINVTETEAESESGSEEVSQTEAEMATEPVSKEVSTETSTEEVPTEPATTEAATAEVPTEPATTEAASEEMPTEPATTPASTEPSTEQEIDYTKDSDKDLLPDYLEADYGCETDNMDTDGDGLPDGYEVYYTYTDPALPDTDGNGITDAKEDFDEDTLNNLLEYEEGTDPWNDDSDYDGLNDSEELYTYNTSPIKPDTDDDKVMDKDELALGLEPMNPQTFGYPDSEYITEQKVTGDNWIMSGINKDEEIPFIITASVKAAGVAENNLSAQVSGYDGVINNDAIIGKSAELFYGDGLKFEEITVEFHLEESVVANTNGDYMELSEEFVGIKRINVFKYFEETNMLLPMKTFHDVEQNMVYTKDDSVGTYCLMDIEIWLESIGYEPGMETDKDTDIEHYIETNMSDEAIIYENAINQALIDVSGINAAEESVYDGVTLAVADESEGSVFYSMEESVASVAQTGSAYSLRSTTDSSTASPLKLYNSLDELEISDYDEIVNPVDVVFQVTASGTYELAYQHEMNSIRTTAERLYRNMSDVRVKVIMHYSYYNYNESAWFSDMEKLNEWLDDNYYNTEDKGGFLYYKGDMGGAGKWVMFQEFWASNPYRANAKKIYIDYWNCMWSPYIGLGGNKSIEQIDGLYYFHVTYYDSAQTYYWGHVIPRENSSLSDVDGARCKRNAELLGHCVANQILDDFGNRVYIVSSTGLKRMTRSFFALDSLGMLDYDADGLTNIEEIDMESGLITKIEDDRYEYPTLKECLAYGNVYTEEGLERFYNDKVSNNLKEYLNKIKVLPLISDPTMKDSDGDGILDNVYDEDGNVYEWVRESEDVFNFSDEKPLRKDVIWEWPAVYTDGTPINRLQSSFGEGRGYPHNGIDITPSNDKAGKGIAVSSYAGRIKTVVWGNVSAGNYVEVETIIDGKKYIQRYLHLNVIDSSIKKDRNINKGDIIGIIGNTGDSSGEHLHYAIGKDVWNNYIDPIFLDNFLNNAPVDNDLVMHMVVPKSLIPTCSWKCEDCENYIEKISLKYNLQWKGWK